MDWLTSIKEAIRYMEENLQTVEGPEEVARHVHLSTMYLQRGFQILTGYGIGEYIRNRRLYQAALALVRGEDKVIDIALDHGYETPESFSKAFTRFHGAGPSEVRAGTAQMRIFLPLRITLSVQGGDSMDFVVEKMDAIRMIGFAREFAAETAMQEIPKFWDEIFAAYGAAMSAGTPPTNAVEKAMRDNGIGEYGVCVEDIGKEGVFRYLIAGEYRGGEVPEGLTLYDVPAANWAKFACTGPLPGALQRVNREVWGEWLPGNETYELDGSCNIEWYSSEGSTQDEDYKSAVWLPVKAK